MNLLRLRWLVLVLMVAPAVRAQGTDETPAPEVAPKPEDAQVKAIREQLQREAAARQAVIDADIARNPNGRNAQEARKAAEIRKAHELEKQSVEEKAKADLAAAEKAAAEKVENERKEAAAKWEAGAAERSRLAAKQKAAVDKWRASGKPAPNIMMGKRANGTVTVMVDGKVSTFTSAAEAQAFVDKVRAAADSGLAY